MDVGQRSKETTPVDGADGVVLWLGRRQNGDMIEWWGE
jgi:hypothetical protein